MRHYILYKRVQDKIQWLGGAYTRYSNEGYLGMAELVLEEYQRACNLRERMEQQELKEVKHKRQVLEETSRLVIDGEILE